MGLGIDLARPDAPLHAAVLDDFKDQFIIALVKRLGRNVDIPIQEIDETGRYVLMMRVDQERRTFHFELREKQ